MRKIIWLIVIILSCEIFPQVGRNFKVTEYGILNYADSKNVVTESVLKIKLEWIKLSHHLRLKIFAPKEQNLK